MRAFVFLACFRTSLHSSCYLSVKKKIELRERSLHQPCLFRGKRSTSRDGASSGASRRPRLRLYPTRECSSALVARQCLSFFAARQLQRKMYWRGNQLLFTSRLGEKVTVPRLSLRVSRPLSSAAQDPATLEFGDLRCRSEVVSFTAPPPCQSVCDTSREPLNSNV